MTDARTPIQALLELSSMCGEAEVEGRLTLDVAEVREILRSAQKRPD